MKYILSLLTALVLVSLPARAAIVIDGTACSGGVASACPSGQTLNTAGGAVTTTTNSFSTSKGGQLLIMIGTTNSSFSGTVSASSGSFSLPITQVTTVQHGGQTYASVYTAVTSSAMSGVTISAANVNSNVNHTAIVVIPFSSPVVLGQQINNTGTGTVATLTSTNILNASLVFGVFSDKSSSTARTPATGTTTVFDSQDATTSTDVYFAVSSTTSSGGSVTLGYSSPSVAFNGWSSMNIEVMDSTTSASQDPLACALSGQALSSPLYNCPSSTDATGASSLTTGSFSTISSVELICASVVQNGVATSAIAISDSGITKSTGWTRVGQKINGTTQDSEVWCAITSAAVSSQTVTATFTSTSRDSSNLVVFPFLYSNTSALPTNYVGNSGITGGASVTITPSASGSLLLGPYTYNGAGFPTMTTSPQSYAVQANGNVNEVLSAYAWANSSSSTTVGVSSPTSTLWSGGLVEIKAQPAAPTGPANSGLEGWWGMLDLFPVHNFSKAVR